MVNKLKQQFAGVNATPGEPEPPPTPPTAPRIFSGTEWYGIRPGRASDIEVRVLGALLTARHPRAVVETFLSEAEYDTTRMEQLGEEWAPVADSTIFHHTGQVLGPLESSLRNKVAAAGGDGTIETVAAALASAEGGNIVVSPASIYAYGQSLLKKETRLRLKGPPRDRGRSHSPRHVSAIPMLMALLRSERRQLRYAVDRHRIVVMHEAKMTHAELADMVVEMEVEHNEVVSSLTSKFEAEVASKQAKLDTAIKLKSKSLIEANKAKGTRREIRKEEKAKAKEKVAQVRESAAQDADEELKRKANRKQELVTAAHAKKRAECNRANAAEELATTRLEENKGLKRTIEGLKTENEELKEIVNNTSSITSPKDYHSKEMEEAYSRVLSMPTWRLVRGKGSGRGGAHLEDTYRETMYHLYAIGIPRRAIGRTIKTVVKATAPWLEPIELSERRLTDGRFELRTIQEALSAHEVALAHAIRMLGFDETTKFGNASITSNVIIEPTPGAKLKPVILRGAYCSAGGTAEAISSAIETKCFGRLRDLLRRWKTMFLKLYPGELWTGPEPERLSMARLAGGGAIISDTCNTAEKAKKLLAAMVAQQMRELMGEEAWGKLSEDEQTHITRVHKLDCWQHMRNIFLNEMSTIQSKLVANELKPQLDAFASWERMTTDFSQLLRAAEKEFHHHCAYYKGKGREYNYDLTTNHPTAFVIHFERADGGRQDLDYDAAIPLYINRKYMVSFLHPIVFGGNHSNILEDFLYLTFTALEYIAMVRANAIIDLLVSRPLRWLTGSAYTLDSFSPVTMLTIRDGKPLHPAPIDLVEDLFKKGEADGSLLLDATLDIFKPVADVQPLFANYRKYMYEEQFVFAPDGKTKHLIYKLAREEIFNPTDPTNQKTRLKTIEYASAHHCSCMLSDPWAHACSDAWCAWCGAHRYLEAQCTAGLRKMHDKKLAIAKHLASQEGASSFANSEQMHIDTIGLDASNDRLSESVFGVYDHVLRMCPGVTMEAAAAVAMARLMKSFEEGGYYHSLSRHEKHALIEMARTTVVEMRAIDAADHKELDEYHVHRRKTNSQIELDALIKEYGYALSFFDRWQERGVADASAMRTALATFENDPVVTAIKGAADRQRKLNQLKLDYLREQIEMRVRGLGFVEFRPRMAWSSGKDEDVGTVPELTALLEDILLEERDLACARELPDAAMVPVMKRKSMKQLGTKTVQAEELGEGVHDLSPDELLELAEKRRKELEVAGEINAVADKQPEKPPKRDDPAMVGTWLEICWRYWRPPTAEEIAKGEKRKKIAVKIWCEGEVTQVANGTTDKSAPQSTNKLAKGALRIRWPEDKERKEKQSYSWHMFQDEDWYGRTRKEAHLSWRFTADELRKRAERAEAAAGAQPAPKRRK